MKDVPQMVYDIVEKEDLRCSSCDTFHFGKKDLSLVGIMPSVYTKGHPDVLTLGFLCTKCQELTLFEIQDMNLMELSSLVFNDSAQSTREDKRAKKSDSKSKKGKKSC